MGVVAVPRESVQEWLLPQPLVTFGEASLAVGGLSEVSVDSLGVGSTVVSGLSPALTAVFGEAPFDPFGSVFVFPGLVGLASFSFDNSAPSYGANLSAGIAYCDVRSDAADISVAGVAESGVLVVPFGTVTVAAVGDASIVFEYYGDGNATVFPFRLPGRFFDPLNIQDGSAYVVVSALGSVDAVSGVASAALGFTGESSISIQGVTPIFPFAFPVVFDDLPANVKLGVAVVVLSMTNESAVSVIGESVVSIESNSLLATSAVFPWRFPVVLFEAA